MPFFNTFKGLNSNLPHYSINTLYHNFFSHLENTVASECSSSVYEEYDPLDFLYGETEMRDTIYMYSIVNKKESAKVPSLPPKGMPSVPAVAKRTTTVSMLFVLSWS